MTVKEKSWREIALEGSRQAFRQEPECIQSWMKMAEEATKEGALGKEVEGMIALHERPFKKHANTMDEYPLMTDEVGAIIADGGNPLLAMEDGLWCSFGDFMDQGNFTLARRTALAGFFLAETVFGQSEKVMEWAGNLHEVSLALGEEGNAEFYVNRGKESCRPLIEGGQHDRAK